MRGKKSTNKQHKANSPSPHGLQLGSIGDRTATDASARNVASGSGQLPHKKISSPSQSPKAYDALAQVLDLLEWNKQNQSGFKLKRSAAMSNDAYFFDEHVETNHIVPVKVEARHQPAEKGINTVGHKIVADGNINDPSYIDFIGNSALYQTPTRERSGETRKRVHKNSLPKHPTNSNKYLSLQKNRHFKHAKVFNGSNIDNYNTSTSTVSSLTTDPDQIRETARSKSSDEMAMENCCSDDCNCKSKVKVVRSPETSLNKSYDYKMVKQCTRTKITNPQKTNSILDSAMIKQCSQFVDTTNQNQPQNENFDSRITPEEMEGKVSLVDVDHNKGNISMNINLPITESGVEKDSITVILKIDKGRSVKHDEVSCQRTGSKTVYEGEMPLPGNVQSKYFETTQENITIGSNEPQLRKPFDHSETTEDQMVCTDEKTTKFEKVDNVFAWFPSANETKQSTRSVAEEIKDLIPDAKSMGLFLKQVVVLGKVFEEHGDLSRVKKTLRRVLKSGTISRSREAVLMTSTEETSVTSSKSSRVKQSITHMESKKQTYHTTELSTVNLIKEEQSHTINSSDTSMSTRTSRMSTEKAVYEASESQTKPNDDPTLFVKSTRKSTSTQNFAHAKSSNQSNLNKYSSAKNINGDNHKQMNRNCLRPKAKMEFKRYKCRNKASKCRRRRKNVAKNKESECENNSSILKKASNSVTSNQYHMGSPCTDNPLREGAEQMICSSNAEQRNLLQSIKHEISCKHISNNKNKNSDLKDHPNVALNPTACLMTESNNVQRKISQKLSDLFRFRPITPTQNHSKFRATYSYKKFRSLVPVQKGQSRYSESKITRGDKEKKYEVVKGMESKSRKVNKPPNNTVTPKERLCCVEKHILKRKELTSGSKTDNELSPEVSGLVPDVTKPCPGASEPTTKYYKSRKKCNSVLGTKKYLTPRRLVKKKHAGACTLNSDCAENVGIYLALVKKKEFRRTVNGTLLLSAGHQMSTHALNTQMQKQNDPGTMDLKIQTDVATSTVIADNSDLPKRCSDSSALVLVENDLVDICAARASVMSLMTSLQNTKELLDRVAARVVARASSPPKQEFCPGKEGNKTVLSKTYNSVSGKSFTLSNYSTFTENSEDSLIAQNCSTSGGKHDQSNDKLYEEKDHSEVMRQNKNIFPLRTNSAIVSDDPVKGDICNLKYLERRDSEGFSKDKEKDKQNKIQSSISRQDISYTGTDVTHESKNKKLKVFQPHPVQKETSKEIQDLHTYEEAFLTASDDVCVPSSTSIYKPSESGISGIDSDKIEKIKILGGVHNKDFRVPSDVKPYVASMGSVPLEIQEQSSKSITDPQSPRDGHFETSGSIYEQDANCSPTQQILLHSEKNSAPISNTHTPTHVHFNPIQYCKYSCKLQKKPNREDAFFTSDHEGIGDKLRTETLSKVSQLFHELDNQTEIGMKKGVEELAGKANYLRKQLMEASLGCGEQKTNRLDLERQKLEDMCSETEIKIKNLRGKKVTLSNDMVRDKKGFVNDMQVYMQTGSTIKSPKTEASNGNTHPEKKEAADDSNSEPVEGGSIEDQNANSADDDTSLSKSSQQERTSDNGLTEPPDEEYSELPRKKRSVYDMHITLSFDKRTGSNYLKCGSGTILPYLASVRSIPQNITVHVNEKSYDIETLKVMAGVKEPITEDKKERYPYSPSSRSLSENSGEDVDGGKTSGKNVDILSSVLTKEAEEASSSKTKSSDGSKPVEKQEKVYSREMTEQLNEVDMKRIVDAVNAISSSLSNTYDPTGSNITVFEIMPSKTSQLSRGVKVQRRTMKDTDSKPSEENVSYHPAKRHQKDVKHIDKVETPKNIHESGQKKPCEMTSDQSSQIKIIEYDRLTLSAKHSEAGKESLKSNFARNLLTEETQNSTDQSAHVDYKNTISQDQAKGLGLSDPSANKEDIDVNRPHSGDASTETGVSDTTAADKRGMLNGVHESRPVKTRPSVRKRNGVSSDRHPKNITESADLRGTERGIKKQSNFSEPRPSVEKFKSVRLMEAERTGSYISTTMDDLEKGRLPQLESTTHARENDSKEKTSTDYRAQRETRSVTGSKKDRPAFTKRYSAKRTKDMSKEKYDGKSVTYVESNNLHSKAYGNLLDGNNDESKVNTPPQADSLEIDDETNDQSVKSLQDNMHNYTKNVSYYKREHTHSKRSPKLDIPSTEISDPQDDMNGLYPASSHSLPDFESQDRKQDKLNATKHAETDKKDSKLIDEKGQEVLQSIIDILSMSTSNIKVPPVTAQIYILKDVLMKLLVKDSEENDGNSHEDAASPGSSNPTQQPQRSQSRSTNEPRTEESPHSSRNAQSTAPDRRESRSLFQKLIHRASRSSILDGAAQRIRQSSTPDNLRRTDSRYRDDVSRANVGVTGKQSRSPKKRIQDEMEQEPQPHTSRVQNKMAPSRSEKKDRVPETLSQRKESQWRIVKGKLDEPKQAIRSVRWTSIKPLEDESSGSATSVGKSSSEVIHKPVGKTEPDIDALFFGHPQYAALELRAPRSAPPTPKKPSRSYFIPTLHSVPHMTRTQKYSKDVLLFKARMKELTRIPHSYIWHYYNTLGSQSSQVNIARIPVISSSRSAPTTPDDDEHYVMVDLDSLTSQDGVENEEDLPEMFMYEENVARLVPRTSSTPGASRGQRRRWVIADWDTLMKIAAKQSQSDTQDGDESEEEYLYVASETGNPESDNEEKDKEMS